MSESPGIAPNVVTFPEAQLRTGRTMREVRARAAHIADQADSAEMHAALRRLSRFLASDEAPRAGAPRGYYLNFTI